MAVQVKDPDSVTSFCVDWSDWLDSPEVIATSTWAVSPTGEIAIDSDVETTTVATVIVSGGVVGKTYSLTNEVVTDATPARTDQRTVTVRVEER